MFRFDQVEGLAHSFNMTPSGTIRNDRGLMLKNIEYLLAEGLWAHISFIQINIQILTQHQRSNSMDVQSNQK